MNRIIMLKIMDQIVREKSASDEGYAFTRWIIEGIPDGADEDMYKEIAEDDAMWKGMCELFGKLINETSKWC